MNISTILIYFSLTILIVQLIKLFPLSVAFLPKLGQLVALLVVHLLLIFLPHKSSALDLVWVSLLFGTTLLFTLVAENIKTTFYRQFFTCYLQQRKLPLAVFALNWDFHSLALLHANKLFTALEHNDEMAASVILGKIMKYPGLSRCLLWHQDLLQIFHYTNQLELAKSYINDLPLDFSKPGIPYGLVAVMMNVYLTANDFAAAGSCLKYLDTHFHDPQHYLLNISNYLIFNAQTGNSQNFQQMLNLFPELRQLITSRFWEAILLLKYNGKETALGLLDEIRSRLPPALTWYKHYIDKIIDNPGMFPSPVHPLDYPADTVGFMPRPLEQRPLFENAGNKGFLSIALLCGVTAAITIMQFLFSNPASVNDFFQQTRIVNLDFIRTGAAAYSYVAGGQWIRLVTAVFLHANWLHLLMNVYGMYIIGRFVGRAYGGVQMFFIFLISGIVGNIVSCLMNPTVFTVGASGGVFGLLAAMLLFIIWNRKALHKQNYFRFILNFAFIIIINILYGLQNPRINNLAHLGGFLAGALFAFIYLFTLARKGTLHTIYKTGASVLTVFLCVMTVSLWPLLWNKDYMGEVVFDKAVTSGGFRYAVADDWAEGEGGRILNPLTNAIVFVQALSAPDTLRTAANDEAIRAYIQSQFANIPGDNSWVMAKELSVAGDGWYYFVMKQPVPDPRYFDKYYFYVKLFPNAFCWVQNMRLAKYEIQSDILMKRFLATIREE